MITELVVKNFKTLRDVTIPLSAGITVMVGANNSGKSNALAALKLLRECVYWDSWKKAVDAQGGWDSLVARDGGSNPIQLSAHAREQGRELRYGIHVSPRGPYEAAWEPPDAESSSLADALVAATVHDFSVAALRAPSLVQQGVELGPDGREVAAVLDNLAGERPSLRDAIDKTVRDSAREVKRVVTRPSAEPGTKVLGIEEQDGRVYGAEDMSDGLLLFIGLAVAAHLKEGFPGILAIEEPERGIHPRRIREVISHLTRLTEKGTQVILTTHSPTLLDEFRDTPESVLIFDRDEQGTRVCRLSDRPEWASELKGAPLGDLWYSGVLGGVPSK